MQKKHAPVHAPVQNYDNDDDGDGDGDDEKEVQDDFVLLLLKVDRATHVTDINQRYRQSRTNGGGEDALISHLFKFPKISSFMNLTFISIFKISSFMNLTFI